MNPIDRIIAKYPETGLVDPFFGTNISLTSEMLDFFFMTMQNDMFDVVGMI